MAGYAELNAKFDALKDSVDKFIEEQKKEHDSIRGETVNHSLALVKIDGQIVALVKYEEQSRENEKRRQRIVDTLALGVAGVLLMEIIKFFF